MIHWLFIISSAAFYAAAFIWTPYCWWTIFFFLVPLFLLDKKDLSFFKGFIWGYTAYGLLLSAVWLVSIEYGQGWFKFVAPAFLVAWFAVFSGIWFFALQTLKRFSIKQQLWLESAITVWYFLWIHYGVLFPFFCTLEGFPFAFPLIPLMHVNMLALIPYIGSTAILLCIVMFQKLLVIRDKKAFFFLIPCLVSFMMPHKKDSAWQSRFVCCAQKWSEQKPYERAQQICNYLMKVREKHPDKKIFILPESTFPFALNEHHYVLKMLIENVLFDDAYIIIGAHRKKDKKLFNSCYMVHKGRIIFCYDKTHLLPFFEQPHTFKKLFKKGNSLFLHKKETFSPGVVQASYLPNVPFCKPLICSETFWKMPYKIHGVALVNDSYFSLAYFRQVMRMTCLFNELQTQSNIFYCSYES